MSLKSLLAAVAIAALPLTAGAATLTGNINPGDTVDILSGPYNFNAAFEDADVGGSYTFTFTNFSSGSAVVTLNTTTINQASLGSQSSVFTDGVVTTFGAMVENTAEGENDSFSMLTTVQAGESIVLTYVYGDPVVTEGLKADIDFQLLAAEVPLPAGGVLLGSALLGAGALRFRGKKS